MAYGVETWINGVASIQSVEPFNLVYSVKLTNLGAGTVNIPITTLSGGTLQMVMGDLGRYDATVSMGGNGAYYCQSVTFTSTTLTIVTQQKFGYSGPLAHGDMVFNFFRNRV